MFLLQQFFKKRAKRGNVAVVHAPLVLALAIFNPVLLWIVKSKNHFRSGFLGRAQPAPNRFENTAWRPLAAMIVTGLTFPLAYWTRSVMPTIVSRTLASLPAPGRRLRSLPRELDV